MSAKTSVLLLSFSLAATAAHAADGRSVNTTELAAWLTGGVSSSRLARIVKERGLATLPTRRERPGMTGRLFATCFNN